MSKRRGGFTLIELLMVIVVISILTSLVTMASMSVISQARGAATKATLRKVGAIILARQKAIEEAVKTKDIDPFQVIETYFSAEVNKVWSDNSITSAQKMDIAQRLTDYRGLISGRLSPFASADRRLKNVMASLEWCRIILPQTWEDADFQRCARRLPKMTSPNPATESAEVLYFLVHQSPIKGIFSFETDTDSFKSDQQKDTDGNGELEFVDGWGNPLRFYRWPTRLLRPNGFPANYKPRETYDYSTNPPTIIEHQFIPPISDADLVNAQILFGLRPIAPDDPSDTFDLQINARVPDASINALNTSAEVLAMEAEYHLPHTHHQPVVISAGADGKFGMHNPSDKASFGYWGKIETVADFYDNLADK